MAAPTLVVDADGHVLEHPDGMLRFAPAAYRERIWHIETKADDSEWLHCNGGVRPAGGMALAGTAGMTPADRDRARAGKLRYSQVRPGSFLPPTPAAQGRKLNDPVYDPIWALCQALELPIGLHPFLSPDMPGACRALGYGAMRAEGVRYDTGHESPADPIRNLGNVFFSQALSNPFDVMECVALFCAGGICERFPKLTVLFLEANGGWIVSWLERLDHHFEVFRWDVPGLKMKPSEYFRRQCYISFDPDESTLAFTANHPLVGAERIIWARDYPHPDAKFPGVVKELAEATAALTGEQRTRIFGANARDVYGLPAAGGARRGFLSCRAAYSRGTIVGPLARART